MGLVAGSNFKAQYLRHDFFVLSARKKIASNCLVRENSQSSQFLIQLPETSCRNTILFQNKFYVSTQEEGSFFIHHDDMYTFSLEINLNQQNHHRSSQGIVVQFYFGWSEFKIPKLLQPLLGYFQKIIFFLKTNSILASRFYCTFAFYHTLLHVVRFLRGIGKLNRAGNNL